MRAKKLKKRNAGKKGEKMMEKEDMGKNGKQLW